MVYFIEGEPDRELAEMQAILSNKEEVLKPAYVLAIADILAHKGSADWLLSPPKQANPDSSLLSYEKSDFRIIDYMNIFLGRFINSKAPKQESIIESTPYPEYYKQVYEFMSENCKKELPKDFCYV